MTTINRRKFLRHSGKAGLGLAAGLTILDRAASVRATPANEKIVMAVVGVRGRGSSLAPGFASRPTARSPTSATSTAASSGPRPS